MPHRFAIGQSVEYFAADTRTGGAALYTIIRQLPKDADDYQYHIQRTGGGEQRLVREAQLRSVSPPMSPAPRQLSPPGQVDGSSRRVR